MKREILSYERGHSPHRMESLFVSTDVGVATAAGVVANSQQLLYSPQQLNDDMTSMELSQSFLNSIHENFLGYSRQGGTRLDSMNYSKTLCEPQQQLKSSLQQKFQTITQQNEDVSYEQLAQDAQSAVNALDEALVEREKCYDMNMDSMLTAWKELAVNKLSEYRNELALLIEGHSVQVQQLEAKIAYYQANEGKDNRMTQKVAITDECIVDSVTGVMHDIVTQIESNELNDQLKCANAELSEAIALVDGLQFKLTQRECVISELTVKLSEQSMELQEVKQRADAFQRMLDESELKIVEVNAASVLAMQNLQQELDERLRKHEEEVKVIAESKKTEIAAKDEMIGKLKRMLLRERAIVKKMEEEAKKVKETSQQEPSVNLSISNKNNESIMVNESVQLPQKQQLGGTEKQNAFHLMKGTTQHRKHRSVDNNDVIISMNQSNLSGVYNSVVKGHHHNKNSSSSSNLLEESNANLQRLLHEQKEKVRLREELKDQIRNYMSEFEQIKGRPISNKEDQKPVQHVYKQFKQVNEELKEMAERVKAATEERAKVATEERVKAATEEQQTLSSQMNNMSVDQPIETSTVVVVHQPMIFKSTNPNITKHLQFNQSSGFAANCSAASAATLLIEHHQDHNSTSNNNNTILQHVSSLEQTNKAVDSSVVDGLRMQINNLTQANDKLREIMINSVNLVTHQKEVREREEKIAELDKLVRDLNDQLGQKSHVVSNLTDIVESKAKSIGEMQQSIGILSEKLSMEAKERRVLHNIVEDMKGKIRVFCRVRPISESERTMNTDEVVAIQDAMTVAMQTKNGSKKFTFDSCLGAASTQEDIFEQTKRMVQSAVDGYNVCIFTYGQTGSGKTYTMQGTSENPGITPRSVTELFNLLKPVQKSSCKVSVSACIVELYMDTLVDLLAVAPQSSNKEAAATNSNAKKLEIKEDPVRNSTYIAGATVATVTSKDHMNSLIKAAMVNRKMSCTNMNTESSRSHFIITMMVEIYNPHSDSTVYGKLSLIDLAGSERILKSNANPLQCKEAQAINLSLTALGDVVSALTVPGNAGQATATSTTTPAKFIPYRNNKLTYLMKDSLGGNSKTLMIVNLSPSEYNAEETFSSLMYASRVKLITNESSKIVETREFSRLKDKFAQSLAENERLSAMVLLQSKHPSYQQLADPIISARSITPLPAPLPLPGSASQSGVPVHVKMSTSLPAASSDIPIKSVLSSLTNILPANVLFPPTADQQLQQQQKQQHSIKQPQLQLGSSVSSSSSVSPSKLSRVAAYAKTSAANSIRSTSSNGGNLSSSNSNTEKRNINNFITHRASASLSKQLSQQQQQQAARSFDFVNR